MLRLSLIPVAAAFALSLSLPADAQRRNAPVTQGMSSGELASEISSLRMANAEMGARITGLESDKASLNGKLETLEFLLSQSRDQINAMQGDDAEIGRLISALEKTLQTQNAKIATLESKLETLQTASQPSNLTAADIERPTLGSSDRPIRRTITTEDGRTIVMEPSNQAQQAAPRAEPVTVTSNGPTRIVRRVETPNSETVTTRTEETPSGTVTTTTRSVTDATRQAQGSLGTISASALPGEAGPLFAEAKSRLLDFDYAGAETAFRSFLDKFGDDPQAGEAQYWLAEVLYQQQAYAESGQAYTTMIRSYPEDQRAPEALAKLARSMRLVGDTEQACSALNLLPNRYPDASGVTKALAAGERAKSGCDS